MVEKGDFCGIAKNDWSHAEVRNDYRKRHNCLVDYHDPKLSEADKEKDREQVKMYWDFLNDVGFGIARE